MDTRAGAGGGGWGRVWGDLSPRQAAEDIDLIKFKDYLTFGISPVLHLDTERLIRLTIVTGLRNRRRAIFSDCVRVRQQQHTGKRHLLVCAAIATPHVCAPAEHLRVPSAPVGLGAQAPQLALPQVAEVLLLGRHSLSLQQLLKLLRPL